MSAGWWQRAACKGVLVEMFPAKGEKAVNERALALCATCPVVAECLEQTLAAERHFGLHHGVAGGMTAKERRAYVKTLPRLNDGYRADVRAEAVAEAIRLRDAGHRDWCSQVAKRVGCHRYTVSAWVRAEGEAA